VGLVKNTFLYTYNSPAKTTKTGILVFEEERISNASKKRGLGKDAADFDGYLSDEWLNQKPQSSSGARVQLRWGNPLDVKSPSSKVLYIQVLSLL
jgi:hypothetical protein